MGNPIALPVPCPCSFNYEKKEEITFSSVEYFLQQFPHFQSLQTPEELTLLQEEFVYYQLLQKSDIPPKVWKEAEVHEGEETYCSIDVLWSFLSTMKKAGSSELKLGRLFKIAKCILVIPHSNASEERVFSMIKKNKTLFRPNLSLDGTLSSLITIKLALDSSSESFELAKDLLDKAKHATWEYNKAHSSKHLH